VGDVDRVVGLFQTSGSLSCWLFLIEQKRKRPRGAGDGMVDCGLGVVTWMDSGAGKIFRAIIAITLVSIHLHLSQLSKIYFAVNSGVLYPVES